MKQTELNKYKALLEAKQSELSANYRARDEIAIENTADALDEVRLSAERELAIRNLDRGNNQIRLIKAALARIADGSYGVCLHCEEDIKLKRLDAVPWAKYCIICHDTQAVQEAEGDDPVSAPAPPAGFTRTSAKPLLTSRDPMDNVRHGMPSEPDVFKWILLGH